MSSSSITGLDPATAQGIGLQIIDGRIAAINAAALTEGPYLSAGLIDLQVNGFRGLDLNDDTLTPDRVIALTEMMHGLGVTTYLPTLITASRRSYLSALEAISTARRMDTRVAHSIPFVHVEGPFISPEDGPRGAHPQQHVRSPDLDEVAEWQRASGNLVGKITLSPHYPGSPEFIRALTGQGILVAIGHTAATPDQIHAAVDSGARLSTHLGNGAAAMLPRHPNFIWAQLADDRLISAFIADGFHLPADTLKAMIRAKGLDRSILVSDIAALGGMPPGIYEQPIGGRVNVSADGCLTVAGTPYLAGAGLPLRNTIALAIGAAGISLAEALQLSTSNPGRLVGGRGRIAVGEPADLILFDWEEGAKALTIRKTLLAGKTTP